MESMIGQCTMCGYNALVKHDGYMVCEECGTINNEDMITSEFQDYEGYQSASQNKWIMNDKKKHLAHFDGKIPDGKREGLSHIKIYSKLLTFSSDMVERAENMFSILYKDEEVIHKVMEAKEALSSACLFVEGRKFGQVISIKEFSKVTGVKVGLLVKAINLIKRKFFITLPKTTIAEMSVEIAFKNNIEPDVRRAAQEIISLCDRAWLVTGRQPQKIIWAAFYISVKSYSLDENRKLTQTNFMKKHGQKVNVQDKERLNEILEILKDIGDTIPWASNKNKKDFVYHNLKDILKYSKMALMEKRMKFLKEMENSQNIQNGESDESTCHKRKLETGAEENIDIFQPPILKKVRHPVDEDRTIPPSINVDCDIEDMGSDIDEELDGYLRSSEEVKQMEIARALIIDKQ
ncbi:transcription factor IIIB 50 kDa subunit-like [Mytilus californianus]|uniref:transcription factor IIIB 50 kDa subunit-like n=1 Tax=Mytilus californianus TaxID=6549 RepID=UPI00224749F2|nr:transcription factor IIIB 50 kDa subunit-like [Mytilus californianus]